MIITPPEHTPPAEKLGAVHFVGIGGAGLSGIARVMLARGIRVSGSDARESAALEGLRRSGATIRVGHDAEAVADVDTVVVSTAIKEDNPEVRAAERLHLPVLPRASAVASLLDGYRVLAVSGAHGKSTTSSMVAVALRHVGTDPSFAIGAVLADVGENAHHGTGELFVLEADESDRAFLHYAPTIAVVTNIDPDHLELYGSAQAYRQAFCEFVDSIRPDGLLVANADDAGSAEMIRYARANGVGVRTFGESDEADVRIRDVRLEPLGCRLRVDPGHDGGEIRVRVPGRHQASNAAAAYTAAVAAGADEGQVRVGLSAFTGTKRRFEAKGEAAGVRVFDDYAHHPTELETNLRAARLAAGSGRLVVCFRPLRHTRTQVFHREFGEVLGLADEVVVCDPSGDDPIPGVTGELLLPSIPLTAEQVCYEPDWARVPARVAERARSGDLVLTAGAPDVAVVGPEVLRLLSGRGAE